MPWPFLVAVGFIAGMFVGVVICVIVVVVQVSKF